MAAWRAAVLRTIHQPVLTPKRIPAAAARTAVTAAAPSGAATDSRPSAARTWKCNSCAPAATAALAEAASSAGETGTAGFSARVREPFMADWMSMGRILQRKAQGKLRRRENQTFKFYLRCRRADILECGSSSPRTFKFYLKVEGVEFCFFATKMCRPRGTCGSPQAKPGLSALGLHSVAPPALSPEIVETIANRITNVWRSG